MDLPRTALADLVHRFGGALIGAGDDGDRFVAQLAPTALGAAETLVPFFVGRYLDDARAALDAGAVVLAPDDLATRLQKAAGGRGAIWAHRHASWALAALLDICTNEDRAPRMGADVELGANVVLCPNVVLGDRVVIGAGAVVGGPGFGWVTGPDGAVRAMPQRAGVVLEDDVRIGPNCTVDAGTLAPTRIRKGAKLDAQVHVGHNVDIGEFTMIAAQSGFAGSSVVGRGVLVGGQVGVGDHVRIGDGARIAGKSGVIGDVPPGAVVAGYPAVPRARWLRALATLYKRSDRR